MNRYDAHLSHQPSDESLLQADTNTPNGISHHPPRRAPHTIILYPYSDTAMVDNQQDVSCQILVYVPAQNLPGACPVEW